MTRKCQRQIRLMKLLPVWDDGEGDGNDSGEDGSAGDSGDDEGGDGETNDSEGSASGSEGVKDPDKKRLHDEAAKHRNTAKAEKKRADEAEKRLREIEDKDKSDLEKAQRDLSELTEASSKKDSVIRDQAIRLAFYESGMGAKFKDPKAALRLMDLNGLEVDEDGDVDVKEITKRAEVVMKSGALVLVDGSDDGEGDGTPSGGTPRNGRKPKNQGSDRQKLENKFPALRGRVSVES